MPAIWTLLAADMVGAAEWQLQTTVEYAATRQQFDHPLGFFQAVKHPLVDVMVLIDQCKSLVYNAACAFDTEPERPRSMRIWPRPPPARRRPMPRAVRCSVTVASALPGNASCTCISSGRSTASCCGVMPPGTARAGGYPDGQGRLRQSVAACWRSTKLFNKR